MDHEITPEYDDLIEKSFNNWMKYTPDENGFSIAASTIIYQMIPNHDDMAWKELEKSWELSNIGKSTMYWESNQFPCNESPFGLIAGLQYMIIRSDTGNINVFPQRVQPLENVTFYNMKAEGGFLVSGVLKSLKTEYRMIIHDK